VEKLIFLKYGELSTKKNNRNFFIKILNEDIKKNIDDIEIKYDDWTLGDIKYFELDNSKVKSLGYTEFEDFEKGLETTINWMKTVFPEDSYLFMVSAINEKEGWYLCSMDLLE